MKVAVVGLEGRKSPIPSAQARAGRRTTSGGFEEDPVRPAENGQRGPHADVHPTALQSILSGSAPSFPRQQCRQERVSGWHSLDVALKPRGRGGEGRILQDRKQRGPYRLGCAGIRGQNDADPCRCLLYTSDAADEEDSVDLGGRR